MLRRFTFGLLLLGVVLCIPLGAQAQTEAVPPPVTAAFAAFNRYLSQPITFDQLDSYQFTQGTYTDSALGCALVAGAPLSAPMTAYRVQFIYLGTIYEFEVSADSMLIVPCSPPLLVPNAVIVVPTVAVPTIGLTGCPVDFAGYLPPQMTVGGYARIGVEGQPNRMREAPSLDAAQTGLIAPGTTVEVLDGPICESASHIVWWQVRDGSLIGWTAESYQNDYFLEPVDLGELPLLPLVRDPITPSNAYALVTLATVPFEGGATVDFGSSTNFLVAGTTGVTIYELEQGRINNLPLPLGVIALHVNFSDDGESIAYSTDSNRLFVYDTVDEQADELEVDEGAIINDLDFSPGNLLAAGFGDPLGGDESFNGWRVYNLDDSSLSIQYPTDSWVGDVAFGPLGLRLAWLSDSANMVVLTEDLPLMTGQLAQPTRTGLAWQPITDLTDLDAEFRLAYADGSTIQLFDVETSDLMIYTNEDDYLPGTLAFNADGSVLAVLNRSLNGEPVPRILKLFDVATGDVLYSERLETARDIAMSPDGSLLIVLTDDALRFYGLATTQDAVG